MPIYSPEMVQYARDSIGALNLVQLRVDTEDLTLLMAILIQSEDGFTLDRIGKSNGPWVSVDDATKRTRDQFVDHLSPWFLEKRDRLVRMTKRPYEFLHYEQSEGIEHFKLTKKGHGLIQTYLAPGAEMAEEVGLLKKVLTAFGIDLSVARNMAKGSDILWLKVAGKFGSALMKSFGNVAPKALRGRSVRADNWLAGIPNAGTVGGDGYQKSINRNFLERLVPDLDGESDENKLAQEIAERVYGKPDQDAG